MSSSFVPISRQRHAHLFWQRPSDLSRAAQSALIPLVVSEIARAQANLPIAFVADGETFRPVAVAGLHVGKSLLVAPDGRWLGRYVPARLRSYPFALGHSQDQQKILMILEPEGLAQSKTGASEAFFVDDKPAPFLGEVLNFLIELDHAEQATQRAMATLHSHGLLEPWPIQLTIRDRSENIVGLYRINETLLSQLPGETFGQLRADGALLLAFAQLMSMQNLPDLARLAELHAAHEARVPVNQKGELDLEFLNQGGTLNFGGMGS
ncbi:SapC family protein [Rhabdaerophilum sp. SD176]|uniref:SapC family protein n=1 Tax=Rhabdaerophilum sp. SD176 TaxID=2983548 RepID=UPI0024DFDE99|nr:SapC family protein [Rhabdaerophilum sp. SD176]